MKNNSENRARKPRGLKTLGLLAVLALAGAALANQFAFVALNIPTALQSATNLTLTNYTGTALQLVPGNVYNFVFTDCGVSSNTQPVVHGLDVSPDNTNWSYNDPIKVTNTLVSGSNSTVLTLDTRPTGNAAGLGWVRVDYLSVIGATAVTNGNNVGTSNVFGSFFY